MRDVSDIILLQVVLRSELEKIVSDFEKQEKESKNIEKLLKQNPNKNTFYELDENYYTSNPSRVPWENISKILRVKEVSRIDLEAKIRQSVEWASLWGLEKYLFSDNTISWFKESSIEWLKWPLALTAWWIDGMLDYIQ